MSCDQHKKMFLSNPDLKGCEPILTVSPLLDLPVKKLRRDFHAPNTTNLTDQERVFGKIYLSEPDFHQVVSRESWSSV